MRVRELDFLPVFIYVVLHQVSQLHANIDTCRLSNHRHSCPGRVLLVNLQSALAFENVNAKSLTGMDQAGRCGRRNAESTALGTLLSPPVLRNFEPKKKKVLWSQARSHLFVHS